MLPFLRSDLAYLSAYVPHPGGGDGSPVQAHTGAIDRLDSNESPYDLPADLKEKLGWQFQNEIESNRYPDGRHASLKDAIAQYVNESAPVDPGITTQQISVGNGSDELIRSLLIATCLGNEGSILVATPTFSMYGILAQTLGIPVVSIDRSDETFELDLDAARSAIADSEETSQEQDIPPIRVVCMVHPNSPTGNTMTEAELNWLRSLPAHILVIIDEAYFEFSQTTVVAELAQHSNWVVLRTFSKAFRLASLRVGYAIAHPELIAALEKVRLPYNLPSFSQIGALLVLQHRQALLASIPLLLQERQTLTDALVAMPELRVWPSDANFIYVRRQSGGDDGLETLFLKMKAHGSLIRHTGGGIRLTVGTPEENQRSLSRLRTVLAELG
ncbi:MAG: histidinol-phosphate transaminase [Synechococcales cyanobacterium T60_A2020_003]|nr:histidinol-phosphate transaminase [Synechococcales cyanobacterium T60_A2020_003]